MRRRHPVLTAVTAFIGLTVFYFLFDPETKELSQVEKDLKIAVPHNSSVTESSDSTGWFGDGEIDIEIALPADADEKKMGITGQNGWHPLPMPKELMLLIYGGNGSNSIHYDGVGDDWIKRTKNVQTGSYFFLDRNEMDLREKIGPLQNRFSQDFTFALYGSGTRTLSYYRYDS